MSRLRIVKVEEATPEQWDRVAEKCDYATYYHTREWARIWEEYPVTSLVPSAKFITFSDGTEVLFPMSQYKTGKGLIKQYVSTPRAASGGWLSEKDLTPEHHRLLWGYASKLNIFVVKNVFDPSANLAPKTFHLQLKDQSQVIDLRPGFEALEKNLTNKKRVVLQLARKAAKLGVVVSQATGLDEWKEFYRVVEETRKHWETVKGDFIDWGLLEAYYRINSPKIQLWVARYEGRIISGTLVCFHHRHVALAIRGNLKEYSRLGAGHLLEHELIKKAAQEGFWWYDMGPSLGSQGVVQYKKSFLAEDYEFAIYLNKTLPRKALDTLHNLKKTLNPGQIAAQ